MSPGKKSGAENRKRQATEAENIKKTAATYPKIGKFLSSTSTSNTELSQTVPSSSNIGANNEQDEIENPLEVDADNDARNFSEETKLNESQIETQDWDGVDGLSPVFRNESEIETQDMEENMTLQFHDGTISGGNEEQAAQSITSLDFTTIDEDPSCWPINLKSSQRDMIIQRGPTTPEPNFSYPVTNGRRFTVANTTKQLSNGETMKRTWLIYSKSKDAVYCFACKIFDLSSKFTALKHVGCQDWKHLSKLLMEHELSDRHKKAYLNWAEASRRLKSNSSIIQQNLNLIQEEKLRWRNILERILGVIQYLASRNLAFQGSNEKMHSPNNGNFLGLIELIAKFDPVLSEHLRQQKGPHYLSHQIQNQFIAILSKQITASIVNSVRNAKYYSIILDCTPDISHIEQMSVVLRYVNMEDEKIKICESFLGFLPIQDKTGEGLTAKILEFLETMSINLGDARGQAYDNGSNMKGKIKGVQKRILDLNSRAIYNPCFSHNINLVIGDAAKSSTAFVTFFGIVQKLYKFASSSTNRWDIFNRHINKCTLKSHSETRWESRLESLKPLRYELSKVRDALAEISENDSFDHDVRFEASTLVANLEKFEFLVMLSIWYAILNHLNIVSKTAQGCEVDVGVAKELLDSTEVYLKSYKINGFDIAITTAKQLAEEIGLDDDEIKFTETRRRKAKQIFRESEPLESNIGNLEKNAEEKWKVLHFDKLMDVIIASVVDRFEFMKNNLSNFRIFYDSQFRQNATSEVLLANCNDLQNILTENQNSDIDGLQLHQELLLFKDSFATTYQKTHWKYFNSSEI